MIVNCDDCKNDFELKLQVEQVNDTLEKVFFECPLCRRIYITQYTNDSIKKKQSRLRKIQSDYQEFRGKNLKKSNIIIQKVSKTKAGNCQGYGETNNLIQEVNR